MLAVAVAALVAACTEANFNNNWDLGIEVGFADTGGNDWGIPVLKDTGQQEELPSTDPGGFIDPGQKDYSAPCIGCPLHECETNDDCNSGYCIQTADGKRCTKGCTDTSEGACWPGWRCSEAHMPGGDTAWICVPLDTNLCRLCDVDDDCNTQGFPTIGKCVPTLAGSICTRFCNATETCPTGFECLTTKPYGDDGPEFDLCVADDIAQCSCTETFVKEGASTTCYTTNEFGSCEGTLMCTEVGPIPECPAPEAEQEVCNGVDDNCDGLTDQDAEGCIQFYPDLDGDGYGQGMGVCACEPPGPTHVTQGGDCNELLVSANPGGTETCNGIDDDCDGDVDEEGSLGCVTQYMDNDDDGYGLCVPGDPSAPCISGCFCSGQEGWGTQPGDCNDGEPSINPETPESCNDIDDDCDGIVDEEGASGCAPFFLDLDGDTFGLSDKVKCLCGPTGGYMTNTPGDCDDSNKDINPGEPEICNKDADGVGIDDNCNGEVNEGLPTDMCPSLANATAGCVDGTCQLVSCDPGWSNPDGDQSNGCECSLGTIGSDPGDTCQTAQVMGNLSDGGQATEFTDNIPLGDSDWFTFTGVDGPDSNSCDSFKVRVRFVHNPGEQFAFDIYKGGCTGSSEICQMSTLFTDYTDFFDSNYQGTGPRGECPCSTTDNGTTATKNRCADQTATYYVRVYRKPGFPEACAAYTIEFSNGL